MAVTLFPGQQAGNAPSSVAGMGPYDVLRQVPMLREDPEAKDAKDSERIAKFGTEYASQTEVLLVRDRQTEYNVRMLCGQQWNVWHPTLGRFFDVSDWLSDEEKAWRQLPVINKLLRWFVITHGRLTENPPIMTVLPGPDQIDAELAEVLDTLVKKDWRDAGMEAVHDELMMWLVVSGRAHAITRLDPTLGEWKPWIATAPVPMVDWNGQPIVGQDGQPAMSDPQPNVPLNDDGSPNAEMTPDGQVKPLGPPHMERSGGIAVDAYSPLQVRGQWGPQLWRKKQWHTVQRFLTPEQVFEITGQEIEPDLSEQAAANVATLERVLFGAGFYGAAAGRVGNGWVDSRVKGALCTVYERWEKPIPFNPKLKGTWAEQLIQTPEMPGGRQTMWTPKAVLYDGPRKVAWPNVSPIRCFDFVRIPGRPSGTTPLEMMLGPQRAYNKSRAQAMEHAALLGSPQAVIDEGSGILASEVNNAPGKIYIATKRPGVAAMEYVAAPPMSSDVYKMIEFAATEMDDLGGLNGTEGAPPTQDASGELVKELRFNSDRLLGATARRNVSEYALMEEDWRALYPIMYDERMVIAINGADNLAQSVTVYPELFKEGTAQIAPDVESMLPEGRGERQQRAYTLWKEGAFGDPQSASAIDIFLEQSRFPNYSRLARPGGPDRVMAEQENGKLIMGAFNQPVLAWYDNAVHLSVHERFMKSPEFLKLDPIVQQAFAFHRQQHIMALQEIMLAQGQMMPPGAAQPDPMGKGGMKAGGKSGKGAPPNGGGVESMAPAPHEPGGDPKSVSDAGGRAPLSQSTPQG
jgi:hypothetical protein